MSKLYMMRHGQTLFNVLERIQGWCDSPLTELGIEQAKGAGRWFSERGITFDHVYSSTSERCCDTTELVVPGQAYERVKGLKEWNFGKFEGQSESLNPRSPYEDFFVQFGGESVADVRARLRTTVTELMRRPAHESVLMVSHGGACARFMDSWTDVATVLKNKRMGNCCIIVYDFDGDKTFTLEAVHNPNE